MLALYDCNKMPGIVSSTAGKVCFGSQLWSCFQPMVEVVRCFWGLWGRRFINLMTSNCRRRRNRRKKTRRKRKRKKRKGEKEEEEGGPYHPL